MVVATGTEPGVDQNPPMATAPTAGRGTRSASLLVLVSIVSVQGGAALATTLFEEVGPFGGVLLRSLFGALVLVAVTRGAFFRMREWPHRDVLLLGVVVAIVNLLFYASLDRLPLGIAVTLEFVGPLGVAIFGSRRPRDAVWALLAGAGIVLLSDGSGRDIDPVGVALALGAGVFWALYIIQSARVGALQPGLEGAAAAAAISVPLVAPFGLAQGGATIFAPEILAVGLAVGFLSTAVPYALEMEALRHMRKSVFGVLMSLEPAVAATIGFVALSQGLALIEVLAIAFVVIASAGAVRSASTPMPRD